MSRTLMLVAGLFGAVAAAPVGATSIPDGSFEIQGAASTSTSGYCYLNSTCATGAWSSTTNGAGIIGENNGDWPGIPAVDGSYFGFIQGGGVLTDTITADKTGTYQVTYYAAGRTRPGYDGEHSYDVTIGGGLIGPADTTGPSGVFNQRTTGFFVLYAGQATKLSFNGFDTGADATTFIDQVSITAVPEPATWALMLGGFGGLGAVMRLRRRSSGVAA